MNDGVADPDGDWAFSQVVHGRRSTTFGVREFTLFRDADGGRSWGVDSTRPAWVGNDDDFESALMEFLLDDGDLDPLVDEGSAGNSGPEHQCRLDAVLGVDGTTLQARLTWTRDISGYTIGWPEGELTTASEDDFVAVALFVANCGVGFAEG